MAFQTKSSVNGHTSLLVGLSFSSHSAELIAERWREYCEELYADNEEVEKENTYTREPAPLRSEVARAIKEVQGFIEVANGKSARPDEAERYAGKMHRICTALNRRIARRLDEFNIRSVSIPKKGDFAKTIEP